MIVKNVDPIHRIRDLLKARNGILFTSDLASSGIPRTYLAMMEKQGEIERLSRGVYAIPDSIVDEMIEIQAKFKSAIFSHETALHLWGLTDRTPLYYSVTIPSGYNATSIKTNGVKVFFVQPKWFLLGLVKTKSPHGNEIKTYDLERTICDLLRSRNRLDSQQVSQALKKYAVHNGRNIDLLHRYAQQFGISKIVRTYMEVLL